MDELEPKIRELLKDDVARFIARYCKTPHTTSEIVKALVRYRRRRISDINLYEGVVADRLTLMEKMNAVTYTKSKWKTSAITLKILAKYFGE